MDLVEEILRGNKRAAARLITLVEEDTAVAREALGRLYPHTGRAHIVGISGPPGAGKSTLILRVAQEFRRRGKRVGIIAVDPTSPITGGALLGDRIRMGDLTSDEGVFIRSMGTRGWAGGVSGATAPAIRILDALGIDVVLVETAGAGQSDVEVANLVDTTVVVLMPGGGDEVQALKAGILEVADLFAVNKADLDGAEATTSDLQAMIGLVEGQAGSWRPLVLPTVALSAKGVGALVDALGGHLQQLRASGGWERRRLAQARGELIAALREEVFGRAMATLPQGVLEDYVQAVMARRLDAAAASRAILERYVR